MALSPTTSRGATSTAGALTLITGTLLAAPGQFSFTAIPATYTHLLVIGQIRLSTAAVFDDVALRFNNDSAASYFTQSIKASAATPAAAETLAATSALIWRAPAASATASYVGSFGMLVTNYAATTTFKSATVFSYAAGTAGSGNQLAATSGCLYISTSAINRIDLFGAAAANAAIGSQVSLYGLT